MLGCDYNPFYKPLNTLNMKTLKNVITILAITLFTAGLYSCDADVTIDDPNADTIENVSADTGEQGNDPTERDG